ncbi:DUF1254-domain-containing protein [Gymnopus androsaceus JB14]|uniref:DUF1254-domain-containing protein n=1 Tax=Gymnopus androsaceus JB14 TaxID=1447944 RepID=A0A6A4IJT4_9AGAR|nr:DUF1254-domain-containing protein [Gymnopus androsaceus JB14]
MFLSSTLLYLSLARLGFASPFTGRDSSDGSDVQGNATAAYIYGYGPVAVNRFRNLYLCEGLSKDQFTYNTAPSSPATIGFEPNYDTIYSLDFLDLRNGPAVIEIPDMFTGLRYHNLMLIDAYSNIFAQIGGRTEGYAAGSYALVYPEWTGAAPNDLPIFTATTWDVWVYGRTEFNGTSDVNTTDALQAEYNITVLTEYAPANTPPTLPAPTICDPVPNWQDLTQYGVEYYDELMAILASNPPPSDDAAAVANLAALGLYPSTSNVTANLTSEQLTVLEIAMAPTDNYLQANAIDVTPQVGANYVASLGRTGNYSGTDYYNRALQAINGIGANTDVEAVYFAYTPTNGTVLDGTKTQVLHFEANELDDQINTGGFWSVTVYTDTQEGSLYNNSLNRYVYNSHDGETQYNADGSLDIFFGYTAPVNSTNTTNWLPTPDGSFKFTIRTYLPNMNTIYSYIPPSIVDA